MRYACCAFYRYTESGRAEDDNMMRKRAAAARINPSLSQHQHQLVVKAVLLVRKLPVYGDLVSGEDVFLSAVE